MKSSLLIFAALLMLATPAAAMSVDHDSNYADQSGSSRFSDPDVQLSGNQFGSVQLGNSSDSSNSGGVTFGMFATGSNNGQNNPPPGYAMQGCMSPVCQH
jgi:hypothetical protein